VLSELVGEPERPYSSTRRCLRFCIPGKLGSPRVLWAPRGWVRWDSFCVYGVKLHLLCATNRVPICYELTSANTAEVCLVGELLNEAQLGDDFARRLFGDLAYRSEALGETLAGAGVLLVTERSTQGSKRQQAEVCFASLKRVFGLGETLATTLVGLAVRIAAKITAYTYAFLVNRRLQRSS
jgi:hypothetical protein